MDPDKYTQLIVALTTLVGVLAGIVTSVLNKIAIAKANRAIEDNTKITIAAKDIAANAKDAAIHAAETTDGIAVAVNGHSDKRAAAERSAGYAAGKFDGAKLVDAVAANSVRIEKLESDHAELKQGHVEIQRSLERVLQKLDSK